MRATIRQVAERANVSRMTVSRVVRGRRHQVNEETYQRVLDAMRELNYIPVRPAMQNHHIETHCIGMVPYYRNPSRNQIDSQTFAGLCDGAGRNGYDLFILLRAEAEWLGDREDLRFLDRRCDGYIFVSPGADEWQAGLESLAANDVPAVVCYRREVPEGVAWVDPDNEGIIQAAVGCLRGHGHTHLAYMGGPPNCGDNEQCLANLPGPRVNVDDRERLRHFLLLAGESPFVSHLTDGEWQLKPREADELLGSGATGIVCVNDYVALQVWQAAEERGLKVPGDISIVGVDNQPEAAHRGLTSVGFGYENVGRLAVQAWLELQAGAEAEACSRVAPVYFTERSSTGPVRG
jgi:DNA-binding LacI/PurR family transcriptional regulator